MLCKDCDYYQGCSEPKLDEMGLAFCEFADMLVLQDSEDLTVEYPCSKIKFGEYLQKKESAHLHPASISKYVKPELFRELKECGVCMLKFPDGMIEKCFQDYPVPPSAEKETSRTH